MFASTTAAANPPIATPVRTPRAISSMVEVVLRALPVPAADIRVLNYTIFLMPRFTGMRAGAGSAGFAGSSGGGAGLSLVMIASRW